MTQQEKTEKITRKMQRYSQYGYLAYAAFIALVVVAQLYSFDVMTEQFTSLAGRTLLICMVVSAVFSLPYILQLRTPVAIRTVSCALTVLLPFFWLAYSIATTPLADIGMLGTVVSQNWAGVVAVGIGMIGSYLTIKRRGIPLNKS